MLDQVYKLILVLNLTGLWRFLAPLVGATRVQYISRAILAANVLYLLWHWPVARRLLFKRSVILWSVVLFVWPSICMVVQGMQGRELARNVGLQLYLATLMMGAAVLVRVRGWSEFKPLIPLSLVISAIGFMLSWSYPAFFGRVAQLVGAEIELGGRAYGFFIQPNLAPLEVCVLALAMAADEKGRRSHKVWAAASALALCGATGSRGGILISFIVVGLLVWESRGQLRIGYRRLTSGVAGTVAAFFAAAVLLAAVVAANVVGRELAGGEFGKLGGRIQFITQFRSVDDYASDPSISARLEAQKTYLALVGERPLLGRGPTGDQDFLATGVLEKTSHNMYLEKSFEYGVPYMVFVVGVLLYTYRHRSRRLVEARLHSRLVTHVVLFILTSGLVAASILEIRSFAVVLGVLLGTLIYPGRALPEPTRA